MMMLRKIKKGTNTRTGLRPKLHAQPYTQPT